MKIKKLLCSILSAALIAVPFMSGCSSTGSGETSLPFIGNVNNLNFNNPRQSDIVTPQPSFTGGSEITPAVWKAENASGNYIYLMGTIHMGDDSVYNMPSYVNAAYDYCDSIAVEADIDSVMNDPQKLQDLAYSLIYLDGTTIADHVSAETYKGMVDLLKSNNAYMEQYDLEKPFLWQALLSQQIPIHTNLSIDKGVDMVFLKKAKNDGKSILEVENIDFQIEMFNSFSDGLNDLMLAEFIKPDYAEFAQKGLEEIYTRWKTGTVDETLVYSTTFDNMTEENRVYYEEYNDKLLTKRNQGMAKAAEQYIDNGQKVFYMVGTLHFYGSNGIIQLLKNDGYTITQMTA